MKRTTVKPIGIFNDRYESVGTEDKKTAHARGLLHRTACGQERAARSGCREYCLPCLILAKGCSQGCTPGSHLSHPDPLHPLQEFPHRRHLGVRLQLRAERSERVGCQA